MCSAADFVACDPVFSLSSTMTFDIVLSRKTVGDLVGDSGYSDVVREAGSTFGNLEMTFNLNQVRKALLCVLLS